MIMENRLSKIVCNTYNYLVPFYERRKSFYDKALIRIDDEEIELYSYLTLVAVIHKNKILLNSVVTNDLLFSNTTLRHIKEFAKQYYYKEDKQLTKKDLMKWSRF